MKNIINLVKINLIMMFRGETTIKSKKVKKSLLYLLIFLCFIPMLVSFTIGAKGIYSVMDSIGQGDSVIALFFVAASFIVFLFGIFYTISTYYIARDIPNYLAMPLRPNEIITSRFITVLLYEYMTLAIFLVPVMIGIGIGGQFGVLYYLFSLLVLLVLPIVPLSLASLIVILIMSFSKKAVNKDRFSMISGLLALGLSLAFSFGLQGFFTRFENPEEFENMLMRGEVRIADMVANYFPGVRNAAYAVSESSILDFLIFIIIAAAAFGIFMFAADKLYFKGLLGMTQQSAKRVAIEGNEKTFKTQNKVWSYTMKELKLVFRTPIYFMNLAIIDFLMPVFLIVPWLASNQTENFLAEISMSLDINANIPLVIGMAFAVFVFISAMNGITATCISREGRQLYIMKYLPMKYKDQIAAKILSGMVVSMSAAVLIIAIVAIFFSLDVLSIVLILLSAFNAVLFTRITGVFIDAANPKLKWDNEQKAVKQNMNLVINMLIGMGAGVLAVLLSFQIQFSLLLSAAVFILGFFIINIMLYNILMKRIPIMLGRIE